MAPGGTDGVRQRPNQRRDRAACQRWRHGRASVMPGDPGPRQSDPPLDAGSHLIGPALSKIQGSSHPHAAASERHPAHPRTPTMDWAGHDRDQKWSPEGKCSPEGRKPGGSRNRQAGIPGCSVFITLHNIHYAYSGRACRRLDSGGQPCLPPARFGVCSLVARRLAYPC